MSHHNVAEALAARTGNNRLHRFVHDYPRVDTWIRVLGGLLFFVGSILFLFSGDAKTVGTWLFIAGSLGMFVGSVGQLVRQHVQRDLRE